MGDTSRALGLWWEQHPGQMVARKDVGWGGYGVARIWGPKATSVFILTTHMVPSKESMGMGAPCPTPTWWGAEDLGVHFTKPSVP